MDSAFNAGEVPLVSMNAAEVRDSQLEQIELTKEDQIWLRKYRQVKAFQQANGKGTVPKPSENHPLKMWLEEQRQLQYRGALSTYCEWLWNGLGIV